MARDSYDAVKRWRRRRKERLVAGFGGKCGHCDLIDDPIVYDFHHLDPDEKDMTISQKVIKWETVVEEAKKCVMLCSHCHRKYHAGVIDLAPDIRRFDETLIPKELSKEQALSMTGKASRIDWSKIDLAGLMKAHDGKVLKVAHELGLDWRTIKRRLAKQ